MLIRFSFFKGKVYGIKIVSVLLLLLLIKGAKGDEIIKNEVEDLNIIISQVVGGQPNVLTILDLSGSMAVNYGGTQIGNWDGTSVITTCEAYFPPNTSTARIKASHCSENTAGTSVCGFINCANGLCDGQSSFNNQVACVQAKAPSLNMGPIFQTICGGPNASNCTTADNRAMAAAAIEAAAGLTQCMGASNCKVSGSGDTNPACDTSGDYSRFKTCMQLSTAQAITANKVPACTGGTPNCKGVPQFGSARLDMALDVFFNILDADNSLAKMTCSDPGKLFDGVNTNIDCKNYMETPFRDVSAHVKGTGSGFKLPTTPQEALIDELSDNDANVLNLRLRPMTYSGANWNNSCTAGNIFQLPQGGFAGASKSALDNVWKFYRASEAKGGTPLAYSLGFDDNNASNSTIPNDALGAYRVELQTDPSIGCRPEFVIVITDGEDTCSGQCGATSGSCSGSVTTNANRRSSVQAISNLRTYYAKNPVQNRGNTFKKEIITFVIGMGIDDPQAVRTLNAMALAGGTHTTGIIRHTAPDGTNVGTVQIDGVLPGGGAFQVFKDFGIANGINTNPSNATLAGCKVNQVSENGICSFQSSNVFDNNFFNTGAPFTSGDPLSGFAFFANNAEQLSITLQTIIGFIRTFTTAGVAPTAPTSSASVAISDRILLTNLTPNPAERLWQGRLALYGFVDEPDNLGSKVIIKIPNPGADLTDPAVVDAHRIFDANGVLNENAKKFFWEAGKNLAERDISTDHRRLFTVLTTDPGTVDKEVGGTPSAVLRVRYEGDKTDFDLANTALNQAEFGISDLDVTNPIPAFCNPPGGSITQCQPSGGGMPVDCTSIAAAACKTCVKNCIRDRIIDFMTGNTAIFPLGDPLGSPTEGAKTDNSFGYDCPDFTYNVDDFSTCAVRLGDIFHSTPVLVGSPSPLFFDFGFQRFAGQFKDRSAAVYVGANDGFVHAFHGGELVSIPPNGTVTNPFNLEQETVPFFNVGTGVELFGFAPPSFLPDSISQKGPESPSGLTPPDPDYRFGDFKTFVAEKKEQRSFFDGSALVADIFIDGYPNGIAEDPAICTGAISAPDGNIDVCGREWHTLLISGYRNGGGAYTALDVTNVDKDGSEMRKYNSGPDYPTHLWTLFDRDFGNTWSEPTTGRVRMTTSSNGNSITVDRWVMFVGGGMDPNDWDPTDGVTFGDAFYAIDIPTGTIIFKFNPDDPIPSTLTADPDLAKMECDMSARVGVFDLNADGYVDVAYAGDTCGRLWRFDISLPIVANNLSLTGLKGNAVITAPNWTGDIAFCATANISQCLNPSTIPVNPVSQRMPIFFAPAAVFDDLAKLHVIFTTGNRRNPSSRTQFGRLYNFIDSFVPAFLAGGSAVSVATKTEADIAAGQIINIVPLAGVAGQFTTQGGSTINNQGEFIVRFPDNVITSGGNNVESPTGEKGVGTPVVIQRALVFTTYAPSPETSDACGAGTGEGRLFALDYLSGEPALARVPGAQDLLSGSDTEKQATVGKTVALGMPTPAQITFGARGSVILTVAFSGSAAGGGANFLVMELPQLPTRTQTLFWEELL
jgi:hypothetical protein